MLKSHSCGQLNRTHVDQRVTMAGWVHRRRDHGRLIFLDLRDREGVTQIVLNPLISQEAHGIAEGVRIEYVLKADGIVARRPPGTENPKLSTGEIEVIVHQVEILNPAKTPPFPIAEEGEVEEIVRLHYRYLDLRRTRMMENIILRHRVVRFLRGFLDARGFVEVETPILIKSTPEGARDYLVPSRLQPGMFYALPQSPQQLKQILMVAGLEKYYQVSRCFRDEDLRADRQPEFTQLDMEMSFVEEADVLDLVEEMLTALVEEVRPAMRLLQPFPRITYVDAMLKYGTDKPDLRFGLEIVDLTDMLAQSQFEVFRSTIAAGGVVRGLVAPGCANYSRRETEELIALAKTYGARGLTTIGILDDQETTDALRINRENMKSVVVKFLSDEEIRGLTLRLGVKGGDLILIAADQPQVVCEVLGQLRLEMGRRLRLVDASLLAFALIVDFPLFSWNKEEKRWDSVHHPFTMPREEDIPLLDTAPENVGGRCYDVVCNGHELSSGSIRIHRRDLQEKVFRLLGYADDEMRERFGHLLEALEYGAPPHGGIAPGIDRLVMLLAGEENIREVIAFPKTQNAACPLTGAPGPVSESQLKELHLAVTEGAEEAPKGNMPMM